MKPSVFILFFSFSIISNAQFSSEIFIDASINHLAIGYKYNFKALPVWGAIHLGLSNQDKFKTFNDPQPEIRIGYNIINFNRSTLYGYIPGGIYFTNNMYYSAQITFTGISAGYKQLLGQNQKHFLVIESGYRFGKKFYIQTYEDNNIYLVSKDLFIINPFCFSIGYGFNF